MLQGDEETSVTAVAAGRAAGFSSLVDRILTQAARRGEDIAIVDGEGALTFRALATWVDAVAERILALPGSAPVAILLPNNTAFIVAILAAQRAQRTFTRIDAEFPEGRARQIVEHAGAGALIVDAETEAAAPRIAPQLPRIVVSTGLSESRAAFPPPDPARVVSIAYTSGSTGEPKGVMRTEQALMSRALYFTRESGLGPEDRLPILQPLAVGSTLNRALGALMMGARICIIDIRRDGARAARKTLGEFRPTALFMVPSLLRTLFGPDDAALSAATRDVRWVRISADRVLRSDVELYRHRFPQTCRLWISIGSNEAHTYASWHLDHTTPLDRPLVPVGYPLPGARLTIETEDGTPVASGEIGEIVVASERLAEGYWGDDALTRTRFARAAGGATRYRTGDFGRLLPDGLLEFVGRRDRQVKVRGNTIHLSEIEAALDNCPGLREAAVIPRAAGGEMQLIVYCAGAAAADLPARVRAATRERLPAPMWPSDVVVLDTLPRLPIGKVDLEELQRLDRERVAAQPATSPLPAAASPLAAKVRESWDGILGAGSFDSGKSFEHAGGHSLAAMQILLLLERKLGRGVPMDMFGPDTRPDDLVDKLSSLDNANVRKDDGVPTILFFPQQFGTGFAFNDFVRRLEARFRVRVMGYGDADGKTIATIDPDAYFDAIANDVLAAGPPKRLWLIGYIFGSRVGVETARRLHARGIAVEFVGLIAGSTATVHANRSRQLGRNTKPALGQRIARHGPANYVAGRLMVRLARTRAKGLVRFLTAALAKADLNQAAIDTILMARKATVDAAFNDLPQGLVPVPVTVFATAGETSASRFAPDLGWGEFCRDVTVVPLPGSRRDVLEGVGADALLAAFGDIETRLRSMPEMPENGEP
jgi:acyl-CoA synthetase (AMP-forming)/AMP-acid ligase II/thioesterase domain-containing protein